MPCFANYVQVCAGLFKHISKLTRNKCSSLNCARAQAHCKDKIFTENEPCREHPPSMGVLGFKAVRNINWSAGRDKQDTFTALVGKRKQLRDRYGRSANIKPEYGAVKSDKLKPNK